jgi:hypothetical protein
VDAYRTRLVALAHESCEGGVSFDEIVDLLDA